MLIRFTQAARRHRIGRTHARHVMATTTPVAITTAHGDEGWLYIGTDDRGLELEIIAVELHDDTLLVIHVMPTNLRGSKP